MSAPCRVAVIGAGFAGLAAAKRLLEEGNNPIIFSRGLGASGLTCGALDLSPWTAPGGGKALPTDDAWAKEFMVSLGLSSKVPEGRAWVATTAGVVRSTDAVGTRILDLAPHAGRVIGVLDLGRMDWNAGALSVSYEREAWSQKTRTRFVPVGLDDVFSELELRYPLPAFAALFDEARIRTRFVEEIGRVSDLHAETSAFLTGPWLGEETGVIPWKMAVGEATSPPEGPFGRRVVKALERWVERSDLSIEKCEVTRVAFEERGVLVRSSRDGGSREDSHFVDAVVIATGGLVGGGVGLRSVDSAPPDLVLHLDPNKRLPPAARDGWDGATGGGAWVRPPHTSPPLLMDTRCAVVGDARYRSLVHADAGEAPLGTVLGAVMSAKRAVDWLLEARV